MATKKKIKGNVNIEDINVGIDNCPGCEREHLIILSRPVSTKNCSRGTGTFTVTVRPSAGQLELSVTFTDLKGNTQDITHQVSVEIG